MNYDYPIDPMIFTLILAALVLVLIIAVIVCILNLRRLYRSYDIFMRGKDAESLEDIMWAVLGEVDELRASDHETRDTVKILSAEVERSFQKFGCVKYNAFSGMGGDLSFAIALLNEQNTGFVIDVVHSQDGCYIYLKEVEEGATEVLLGPEEQEALEQALGYIKRPSMEERIAQKNKSVKKENVMTVEQSIEIAGSERARSEKMKELRRKQAQAEADLKEEEDELIKELGIDPSILKDADETDNVAEPENPDNIY